MYIHRKNSHLPNDPILKKISGTLSRFNAAKEKDVKNMHAVYDGM